MRWFCWLRKINNDKEVGGRGRRHNCENKCYECCEKCENSEIEFVEFLERCESEGTSHRKYPWRAEGCRSHGLIVSQCGGLMGGKLS